MKSIKMFGKSVPLIAIVLACMLTVGASALLADYLSNTVAVDVTVTSPMTVAISTGEGTNWAIAQELRPPIVDGQGNPGMEVPDWAWCSCGLDGKYTAPVHITREASEAALHTWYETGGRGNNTAYIGGMVDAFPEGDVNHVAWTKDGKFVMPDIKGGETITIYVMSTNLADAHIEGHEEIRLSNLDGIAFDEFEGVTFRCDSILSDRGYGQLWLENLEPDAFRVDDYTLELWPADDTSGWDPGEIEVAQWQITFEEAASGTYTFSYRITPEP